STASIVARRRRFQRVSQEWYELPVLVWDDGVPVLSSTATLTLRVCSCQRGSKLKICQNQAFLTTTGLSTGALAAILLCLIILLGRDGLRMGEERKEVYRPFAIDPCLPRLQTPDQLQLKEQFCSLSIGPIPLFYGALAHLTRLWWLRLEHLVCIIPGWGSLIQPLVNLSTPIGPSLVTMCLPKSAQLNVKRHGNSKVKQSSVEINDEAKTIVILFITLRRSKKEPLIISEEDIRENVVTYDDEGGGEEDTEAFDIIALRNPAAAEELKFRRDVRPEYVQPWSSRGATRVRLSPSSLDIDEEVDVGEFIKQRVCEADQDTSVPPYDSLQTYAYEGQGSLAGSISSLGSVGVHSELDYSSLDDWGPKFEKIAELFGDEMETGSESTEKAESEKQT
ncbi:hypothetical protein DNTS_026310, partial [Danionella cerebrum]